MSLFRTIVDSVGVPSLFAVLGDRRVLTYTGLDGTTSAKIDAITRSESSEFREMNGDIVEVRITQVLIKTEQLATVDFGGHFTDEDGTDWDLDATEGRGVEFDNESARLIHLIERVPRTRSGKGRERIV